MTVVRHRRRSSTDGKVEAKRKIIRRSLEEITAEVVSELQKANLNTGVSIVVPSRYTLVAIAGSLDGTEEWSRMSEVVRRVVGKKLGGNELRGRSLARAVANAGTDVADVPHE